jgi:hypothetical protein
MDSERISGFTIELTDEDRELLLELVRQTREEINEAGKEKKRKEEDK